MSNFLNNVKPDTSSSKIKLNFIPEVVAFDLTVNFEATVEKMTTEDIVSFLRICNDRYYNSGEPLLHDDEYDQLRDHLQHFAPNHSIFHEVGADTTSSENHRKVNLPCWMGSMDKVKNEGALQKWMERNPSVDQYVVTDKLDGVSALFVVSCLASTSNTNANTPKRLRHLYTRGNGSEGHDISDMISHVNGLREAVYEHTAMTHSFMIRGELVISKSSFSRLVTSGIVKSTSNPRNTVSGVVNAKRRSKEILECIDFIAYELIEPERQKTRCLSEQLDLTASICGAEFVVYNHPTSAKELPLKISDHLKQRRLDGPYEIDGVVITTDVPQVRNQSGNPKYATAFKMNIIEEVVHVRRVEWNLSKDGYLKPVVWFDPIMLGNVTIQKATGFNAKFVSDYCIGVGAQIVVTRSGDVIPFITKVLKPSTVTEMPTSFDYEWNSTGVDIKLVTGSQNDAVKSLVERRTFEYLVEKLDFRGIGKGIVHKLFDRGINNIHKLLQVQREDLLQIEGVKAKSAGNILKAVSEAKEKLTYERIMVASNVFGRGVGPKSASAVMQRYPDIVTRKDLTIEDLNRIEGFNTKTSTAFLEGLPKFQEYLDKHNLHSYCRSTNQVRESSTTTITTTSTSPSCSGNHRFENKVFVFSGARNKRLMEGIRESGGTIVDSMSAKVDYLVMEDSSTMSAKKKYAVKHGIQILDTNDSLFNGML